MKANLKAYQKSLTNGYDLDFGQVIEKSFDNYKITWGIGALAILILGVVVLVLGSITTMLIFGFEMFTDLTIAQEIQEDPAGFYTWDKILVATAINSLIAGLAYPYSAGIYKMIFQAKKDGKATIKGLFDYYSSVHTKDLVFAGILIAVITNLINYTFLLMSLNWLGFIFQLIIGLLFIFVVNIIIFCEKSFLEALSDSVTLVLKNPLNIIGLALVAIIFALLGVVGCGIGVVFTFIYIYINNYFMFDSIASIEDEASEIDFIGQDEE